MVYNDTLAFLGTDHFCLGLRDGNTLSFDNSDWLTELPTNNQDYHKMVFGIKTVALYNTAFFFFQLVGSKILLFQKKKDNKMECVLSKKENYQHN